tara:strand:- start:1435 stop:2097 length:663 start_codon:yes stop_codon:yes gene_type:complete
MVRRSSWRTRRRNRRKRGSGWRETMKARYEKAKADARAAMDKGKARLAEARMKANAAAERMKAKGREYAARGKAYAAQKRAEINARAQRMKGTSAFDQFKKGSGEAGEMGKNAAKKAAETPKMINESIIKPFNQAMKNADEKAVATGAAEMAVDEKSAAVNVTPPAPEAPAPTAPAAMVGGRRRRRRKRKSRKSKRGGKKKRRRTKRRKKKKRRRTKRRR